MLDLQGPRQTPKMTGGTTVNQLLFNEREVCERLRIGRSTLRRLQSDGRIHPVHIGRAVRYTGNELDRYVAALEALASALNDDRG